MEGTQLVDEQLGPDRLGEALKVNIVPFELSLGELALADLDIDGRQEVIDQLDDGQLVV